MDIKDNTFIPLVILFFALGLIIGYVIHKPQTTDKIQYINKTIEKIVYQDRAIEATATATLTPTAQATTSLPVDFSVKFYDPFTDKPTSTIELTNWRAVPDTISVRSGGSVLIKINDYSLQSPIRLILNSSYQQNLGTSGAVVVTFNKKGRYAFKAVISSSDPNIIPTNYGEGTISVY